MTRQLTCLTLALCALCAGAPADAAEPVNSMVVVRDAATGQLRAPTAAELAALNAQRQNSPTLPLQASTDAPRPVITTAPDGTLRATMGKESLIYAVTQRDADGKLKMQCVKGQQAATSSLNFALPAATHTEEHNHDQ